MASSEWGGGGELLSLPLPFFFLYWRGGVGEGDHSRAAIMNNVQIVPGDCECFINAGFLRLNAQSPQNHETQIALQLSHEHTFNLIDLSLYGNT